MAKRPNQGIKNKTSRSPKTKKRIAVKQTMLAARSKKSAAKRSKRA